MHVHARHTNPTLAIYIDTNTHRYTHRSGLGLLHYTTHTLTHTPPPPLTVHGVSRGSEGKRGGGHARQRDRAPTIRTAQMRKGNTRKK